MSVSLCLKINPLNNRTGKSFQVQPPTSALLLVLQIAFAQLKHKMKFIHTKLYFCCKIIYQTFPLSVLTICFVLKVTPYKNKTLNQCQIWRPELKYTKRIMKIKQSLPSCVKEKPSFSVSLNSWDNICVLDFAVKAMVSQSSHSPILLRKSPSEWS